MIGIAYLPVAAGSPGPLDRKIPFGFNLIISEANVLHETTVTLQLKSEKYLKMFFFYPIINRNNMKVFFIIFYKTRFFFPCF